jgi:hypothetical protein
MDRVEDEEGNNFASEKPSQIPLSLSEVSLRNAKFWMYSSRLPDIQDSTLKVPHWRDVSCPIVDDDVSQSFSPGSRTTIELGLYHVLNVSGDDEIQKMDSEDSSLLGIAFVSDLMTRPWNLIAVR